MNKNAILINLLFGVIGGLCIFLLDVYHVYSNVDGLLYFALHFALVFICMLLFRKKQAEKASFSSLFKKGILFVLLSLFVYTAAFYSYCYLYLSQNQKEILVDEKIGREIMAFEGAGINIFSLDDSIYSYLNPNFLNDIFLYLFTTPLYVLVCVIFALILKPKIKHQDYSAE